MKRTISLVGANSNDIYTLPFPENIIDFCSFDYSFFLEQSIALCRDFMQHGDYLLDEVVKLRTSICASHKYIEHNIRGVFEKVVIDSWIEFICRQNEISATTLWNSFMECKNDFEKEVFSRLCEFRYGRAINQWVNILKIQDYAKSKVDFIFGKKLKNSEEARLRASYFDLLFNLVANEQGYEVGKFGVTKIYTSGRTPSSPFIFNNTARETLRHVLTDVQYASSVPKIKNNSGAMTDLEAMEAFSLLKHHIPKHNDNIANTIIKSLSNAPSTVFMPTSFKAAIDLEIDALLNSGAIIQVCGRCREYYVKDEEYQYDYCDKLQRDGRTCLSIMQEKGSANATYTRELPRIDQQLFYGEKNFEDPNYVDEDDFVETEDDVHEDNYSEEMVDESDSELEFHAEIKRSHNQVNDNARYNESKSINDKNNNEEKINRHSEPPKKFPVSELNERCNKLYKEMTARVNVDMTQRDFSDWFQYMLLMRDNVSKGIATAEDFVNFEEYSHSISFNLPKSTVERASENPQKQVKPYVFERIDRKTLEEQGYISKNSDEDESESSQQKSLFSPVTPPVSPVNLTATQPVSRIIRAGTPLPANAPSNYYEGYDFNQQQPKAASVVIPNGDSKWRNDPPPRSVIERTQQLQKMREQTSKLDDNTKSFYEARVASQQNDADNVKIYSGSEDKPNFEGVRVYNPKNDTKRPSKQKRKLDNPLLSRTIVGIEDSDITIAEVESEDNSKEKIYTPFKDENNLKPLVSSNKSFNYSDIRERNDEDSADSAKKIKPIRDFSQPFRPTEEPPKTDVRTSKAYNAYTSQFAKSDESDVQFVDILKNIDRSDGFVGDDNEDTEGVQVSHKTKHLMDAIFKPATASPSLSATSRLSNNKDKE